MVVLGWVFGWFFGGGGDSEVSGDRRYVFCWIEQRGMRLFAGFFVFQQDRVDSVVS